MADFELLESLGAGHEGSVVRAHDRRTGELVALKAIGARVRLRRLRHPALAAPTECVQIDGAWFAVMPWADGPSLDDVVANRGPLPMEEVLDLVAPVADALRYLHERRAPLAHGDVKPGNIVLTRDLGAVLVDVSPPWPGKGTRGFRAPEVGATVEPTPASDVFSLAATIVALATGEPPGASPAQTLVVGRALRRALAVDPARRPGVRGLLADIAGVPTNRAWPPPPSVGRGEESAVVAQMLLAHRLVTVTGIGGIGKSHLTTSVAHDLRARFPSGVWLTRLEDTESATVARAFAQSLQVEAPSRGLAAAIAARLGAGAALLVLDTPERTPAGTGDELRELLDECATLRVLVASREPVGVEGEAIAPLGPLAIADAQTMAAELGLSASEVTSGVPLVIRLGAGGAEAVTSAVTTAIDALDERTRTALARLSIFSFPFTRAAAWAVARADRRRLDALVSHGLVTSVGDRYRLLDSVADSVRPLTPDVRTRRRLQRWSLVTHGSPPHPEDLDEALAVAWHAIDTGDADFLGAAFDSLVDRLGAVVRRDAAFELASRVGDELPRDSTAARRARLYAAWFFAADKVQRFADEAEADDDEVLRWAVRSGLAFGQGTGERNSPAELTQRDAAACFRLMGEPFLLVLALCALGGDLIDQQRPDDAQVAMEEAVEVARDLGLPWLLVASLDVLATALFRSGEEARARAAIEETIGVQTRIGNHSGAAWTMSTLAALELSSGNRARALTMLESSAADLAMAGSQENCALVLNTLGAAHADDDPERAMLLFEAARALAPHAFMLGGGDEEHGPLERCRAVLGPDEAGRIADLARSFDLPTAADVALAP